MSKKRLNTQSIANELSGASAFFRPRENLNPQQAATPEPSLPQPQPVDASQKRSPERPNERTTVRTPVPPNARTGERSPRRRVRRYSFEFYEDQIERVKRLALEDQLRGGNLNMSEIVREAVDRYLAHLGKAAE